MTPTGGELAGSPRELQRLRFGEQADPHCLLGPHPLRSELAGGVAIRAYHPEARGAWCVFDNGEQTPMSRVGDGLFAAALSGQSVRVRYRLRFELGSGATVERGDPYRHAPTLGEAELRLFQAGTHQRLHRLLGAHPGLHEGSAGTAFAVWAPTARRVSVVGDFCGWDGRLLPMRRLGDSGVWELFVPDVGVGATYRFEIRTAQGGVVTRTDPFAAALVPTPEPVARVEQSAHTWQDAAWLHARPRADPERMPLVVYEVHLGSWARPGVDGRLGYRALAPRLVEHARRYGFTHLELMPIAEHAFYGSWGYQTTGYFAPTARYGSPDDLRYFVDYCHQHGLGVILDWVPAHFPKDDSALRAFDGSPLFERRAAEGERVTEWGTLAFDYGRAEVQSFLVSNALYWLEEFHLDGLRVDAVAAMLGETYRAGSSSGAGPRDAIEREQAIGLLRATTRAIGDAVPDALIIAEDSTATSGVTRPAEHGGLGFTFKWNLGWMHDTLRYFSAPPAERPQHHDGLVFAATYEHTERFINSLSHDEVVYGKRSLLEKMPGNPSQQRANLRLLLTYQFTRPGKVLLFMGSELAQSREWDHEGSLDWSLADDPTRPPLGRFLIELARMYHDLSALWRGDPDPAGFEWIDCEDREGGVLSYLRRDEHSHVVVVLNLMDRAHDAYRIGAPAPGRYHTRFNTDQLRFGGRGSAVMPAVETEDVAAHGRAQSLCLRLPPLTALVLVPE